MKPSIRAHLNGLVIALALPVAFMLVYDVVRDARDAVAQSKASMRTLTSVLVTTAESQLNAAQVPLHWLSTLPSVRAMDATQCPEALNSVLALNSQLVNAFFVDVQSQVVCAALPLSESLRTNVTGSSQAVASPLASSGQFGPPVFEPTLQKWVAELRAPVLNSQKNVLGSVHLFVDLSSLNPGIAKEQLPAGSHYGFFDDNGTLVWRNDIPADLIGKRSETDVAKRIVSTLNGEFEGTGADRLARHFSVLPVPRLGWVAFVDVPMESIYAKARSRALVGAGIGLVLFSVLLWIAFALARRIGRPLQALAQAARAMGSQHYGVRVKPSGPAELVVLAKEFNAMATAHQQAQERLQLAASVFTHAREAILITDAKALILDVNDTFTAITGYTREEVLGQNPRFLQSGHHSADFYVHLWAELSEHGHWSGELWNRRKGGEIYAEMCTISAVRDAKGVVTHYVSLFSDITSRKKRQQELERIAHYDPLTGLPNRLLLGDRLNQAMLQSQRRGKPLALAFMDLDGFKAVNDQHGHDVGDQLLITLAQRMKLVVREGDTLSRLGGDEFVVVLVDLEQSGGFDLVLNRMLNAVAEPVILPTATVQVSASIGVALFPQDGGRAQELLRHADQAMYQAKQAGRNRWCRFDASVNSDGVAERSDFARL